MQTNRQKNPIFDHLFKLKLQRNFWKRVFQLKCVAYVCVGRLLVSRVEWFEVLFGWDKRLNIVTLWFHNSMSINIRLPFFTVSCKEWHFKLFRERVSWSYWKFKYDHVFWWQRNTSFNIKGRIYAKGNSSHIKWVCYLLTDSFNWTGVKERPQQSNTWKIPPDWQKCELKEEKCENKYLHLLF